MKESKNRKLINNVSVKCDLCKKEFLGQSWMKAQKTKLITCRECWRKGGQPISEKNNHLKTINDNEFIGKNTVIIYTDGATVGHNGKLGTVKEVGLGMWVPELEYGDSKKVEGISNNEAEFQALIWAMEWSIREGIQEVCFKMDSQIVTNRANGAKPKSIKHVNHRMNTFQDRVLDLKKEFEICYFKWIPREQNEKADYYSKEATKMDLEIESEYNDEDLIAKLRSL